MPKSRKFETLTAKLNAIRADPTSEVGVTTLAEALDSQQSIAISRAVNLPNDV